MERRVGLKRVGIVGAGPAGLVSALHLVGKTDLANNPDIESRYNITIFEKNEKIRSTLCGEAIAEHYLRLMKKRTGFDSFSSCVERKRDGYLVFPDGKKLKIQENIAILDRQKWMENITDLLTRQQVDIRYNSRVVEIDHERGTITVGKNEKNTTEFDIVIDAGGPGSPGKNFRDGLLASQLSVPGTKGPEHLEFIMDRRFSQHGAWIFPKGDRINVGLIGKRDSLESMVKHLEMERGNEKIRTGIIPVAGQLVKKEHFAIGDCCGMCGAVSGGGLHIITEVANILGKCIEGQCDIQNYWKEVENICKHEEQNTAREANLALDQKQINRVGAILDGENIFSLGWRAKFRLAMRPGLKKRFSELIMGFTGEQL